MIAAKIDVTKINKEYLYKGKSGTYLDVTLIPNKDGQDQYGNDGFIAQSVSKELRDQGVKGPIVGNYKTIQKQAKQQPKPQAKPQDDKYNFDDVPF